MMEILDHIHTRPPGSKKPGLFKRFSRQRSTTTEPTNRPKSECTNLSFDKEFTRSDELLDLMVAQGKISKDDRTDLLHKFATAANYKTGDAQRMILGNLVKTGKISIDDAVHYSRLLGIVASAETEAKTIAEVSNAFQDKRVYNFGVYKYYKHRTCQRRILQIDFQSCQICNIQKGNLNRKFGFAQVTDYESEEGLRFFIYFRDHQEYELEADSLEEKEKICRLLNLIVEQNKSTAKGRVLTQADFQGALTRCQAVVKEGFLEKKNHNLYTTWTRRWVRIRQGELSYYKPDDDNQQALNILQLSDDVTIIKKLNFNSFSIETRKKVYYFRIITAVNLTHVEAEKHRDEWFKAIRFASGDRRQSVAHLGDDVFNKNTVLGTVPPQPPKMDRESVNLAIRGFYEELEVLGSYVGTLDAKGDCQKTMGKLQSLAKQLETFLTEQRSESEGSRPDSSCANSTSMDTESTSQADTNRQSILENGLPSDQSFDDSIYNKRQSLILRNSWARLDNGNALANLANSNDPSKTNLEENGNGNKDTLVNGPQRTSLILNGDLVPGTGNALPTVPESIPPPPAPPPPPSEILPVITKKFEVTCKVKMRPFHWNKVPVLNLKNSVWMDARDLTGKIDTDTLEKCYAAQTSEKQEPETNKKKLKSFLDPKVAQNLAIFLVGFKMDPEELKYRLTILSEQDGGLTTEHINVLRRYHPTAEDIETYKQFKDTPHELENTDQFMMQLCEIPNLKTRLDLLMIINDFPVAYNDLAPTIDRVFDALNVLCHCAKFVSVLEYVLAVGNYINSGSTKGVAIGFRLTTLPKLSECKSKDKNVTLLKFLVQQIHKHEPGLMDFVDDLIPLTLVPEVSIKALQAESEVMKKDLSKIRRNSEILMKAENPPERDVLFCEEVEAFVEQYDGKLTELSEKSEKVKDLYDKMLVRFGEPIHSESEEIFTAISEFVKAFKREADITLMAAGQTHLVRRKSKLMKKHKKQDGHALVDATSSSDSQSSRKFDISDSHSVTGSPEPDFKNTHVATLRKAFSDPKTGPARSGQDFLRERQTQRRIIGTNPTKEGWLEKLASNKSPLASQWNKRYFELTNKGQLYYTKKKNEKNVESIYLRGSPVALEDDRTIVIQTEEKVYKLRAPTHMEANDWMQCLLVYTVKPANVPKRGFSQYPNSMDMH